ncbi:DUF3099 domain-containing protein [uncultured Mycolicibacterium sp.]|jgi:Protein of unknown function (DUF3099).|uniref:DUF3099 domain-containing protein n=1 Tax=uncultured Mycolicibacterium sp. TaxID=2320817 RepID=UPI00262AE395|nr:DUF3099 domain-containing protein [uncultured Mycolicibacterium sp.]
MDHGRELGFDDDGRPILITTAELPYEVQHRQRVRKYLTLMSFRIPALILAAIAYGTWHNGLISLAIIVVSIPLPWMAVLIANDRPPRKAEEPRRYAAPPRAGLFPTAAPPRVIEGTVEGTVVDGDVAGGGTARDGQPAPDRDAE